MVIYHITFSWPEICMSLTEKLLQYRLSTTHVPPPKKKKNHCFMYPITTHTHKKITPMSDL